MPCYHPLTAFWSRSRSDNGKHYLVFNPKLARDEFEVIQVPCGQCIGCRLEYARVWATRCWHESLMHDQSYFVTLTYDDDHLKTFSLVPEDLTNFFKRLRKYKKIRYYACGEYGDKNGRPHYHAVIFGLDLNDLRAFSINKFGDPLYRSPFLASVWNNGFVTIGEVTFQSCSYVARYVMKKQKGKGSKVYDELGIIPPFVRMSRRPGIGYDYFMFNRSQIESQLFVRTQSGKISPLFRYYENLLSYDAMLELDQKKYENILKRQNNINYNYFSDKFCVLDWQRSKVLEVNKEKQITSLKRSL